MNDRARRDVELPLNGNGRRILVVDDARDTTDALVLLVRQWGHDSRGVYDGATALAVAAEHQPDTVLLDIGMPGMDGYEVAGRIRKIPGLQTVLIVALTGHGKPEDLQRSGEAGITMHLVKPVDQDVLKRVLEPL